MAFLAAEELKTVAYSYQIQEITGADDEVITSAIATAIAEVAGYLRANNKKEFGDGRLVYDVDAVFEKRDDERDALILQYTKVVALWHLIILCNVDMIYEHIKERYDRVIDFFKKVNKGDITLNLPLLEEPEENKRQAFRFGSRTKFNHE